MSAGQDTNIIVEEREGAHVTRLLKIHQFWLLAIIISLFLYLIAGKSFLKPYEERIDKLADALIIGGLVVASFEYRVRKENEKIWQDKVATTIRESISAELKGTQDHIMSTLSQGLMLNNSERISYLNDSDKIALIRETLTSLLEEDSGQQLWDAMVGPTLGDFADDRCISNFKIHGELSRLKNDYAHDFFEVSLTCEVESKLSSDILLFTCTNDRDEFLTQLDEIEICDSYFIPRVSEDDLGTAFTVEEVTVRPLKSRKSISLSAAVAVPKELTFSKSTRVLAYSASNLASLIGKQVNVTYKIKTWLLREGHVYFVKLTNPTHGLHLSFDSGNCKLNGLSVLDFLACSGQPQFSDFSGNGKFHKRVDVDGWVFAGSGLAFVWK